MGISSEPMFRDLMVQNGLVGSPHRKTRSRTQLPRPLVGERGSRSELLKICRKRGVDTVHSSGSLVVLIVAAVVAVAGLAGRSGGRRRRLFDLTDAVGPRLSLLKEPESAASVAHLQWTPAESTSEAVLAPFQRVTNAPG
ncbi:hypothetical protein ASG92_22540 [Arthrobacter sp. Soil736]|nr:hypothetical protein ASG92_22540 [Arthrobacter sp. Soil736]